MYERHLRPASTTHSHRTKPTGSTKQIQSNRFWGTRAEAPKIYFTHFFSHFIRFVFDVSVRVSCEKCKNDIATRIPSTAKGNHNHQRRLRASTSTIWTFRSFLGYEWCDHIRHFFIHFISYCCGLRFQFYSTFEFRIRHSAAIFARILYVKPYRFNRNW